tara:strand:- start:73 stop:579 length:507 start_codon:yes stop_codon:yes gene_type:complete
MSLTTTEMKSVGTQYSLDEDYTPLCGPASWKRENNITRESSSESDDSLNDEKLLDLAPSKLIRCCKESCWAYGHNVLQACGRKRLKDILVNSHECIIDGERIGHWHYLVMSLYQNDSLKYAHVSVYIDGPKHRNDIADYVLRNRACIKKIDFKTQENIEDLIRRYYVN